MFVIRLIPPDSGEAGGEQFGEIVIDDFNERFACHPTATNLETNWRTELAALSHGDRLAVLRHEPRFAWVVYREGSECFVQHRLSLDGTFGDLLPRAVTTEDGDTISTWVTSFAAVQRFLNTEPDAELERQDM